MRVAVAMLLVALSGYPVLAQQPYMNISVSASKIEEAGQSGCTIRLTVMNFGHVTIDNITLHVSVEDSDGNSLGSITKNFRYIDPDKYVSSRFLRRWRCSRVVTMTIREVTSW